MESVLQSPATLPNNGDNNHPRPQPRPHPLKPMPQPHPAGPLCLGRSLCWDNGDFLFNPVTLLFKDRQLQTLYWAHRSRLLVERIAIFCFIVFTATVSLIATPEFSYPERWWVTISAILFFMGFLLIATFQKWIAANVSQRTIHWFAVFCGACAIGGFQIGFLSTLVKIDDCRASAYWTLRMIHFPIVFHLIMQREFVYDCCFSFMNLGIFFFSNYFVNVTNRDWCIGTSLSIIYSPLIFFLMFYLMQRAAKIDFIQLRKAESALIESKRVAEEANDAKRSFISYTFHEVRVPLNAISAGISVLHRYFESIYEIACGKTQEYVQDSREVLDVIGRQIDSVVHILDSVLTLQKIEQGKYEISCKPFNLVKELKTLNWTFTKLCEAKNVSFKHSEGADLPRKIIADHLKISQVLNNLISNALKFTPENGVIKLHVEKVNQDSKLYLRFSVTDSGIGISEENQKLLFQPYFQVDAERLQKGKGTGLGLSISQHIVKLHGGEIDVYSAENAGSTFFFTIPLVCPPDEAEVSISNTSSSTSRDKLFTADLKENEPQEKRKVVLLVEDSIPNQKLVSRMLTMYGYQCQIANDGLEAVRIVKNSLNSDPERPGCCDFDVIIMDQEMPRMRGDAATKELRSLGCRTPILALTGNAFEDARNELLRAGADDFLTKPIVASVLLKEISKWSSKQL